MKSISIYDPIYGLPLKISLFDDGQFSFVHPAYPNCQPVGSIHLPTGDGEHDIKPNVINTNVIPNIFFIFSNSYAKLQNKLKLT